VGSGNKGLYLGTKGSWLEAQRTGNYEAAMKGSVTSWAQHEADMILSKPNSKGERKRFNTACIAFDEVTGEIYYGRNNGIELKGDAKHPTLFGTDGVLPKVSLNGLALGNCAEVDAINQALNNGSSLHNLRITTIFAIDQKHAKIGDYKLACENCTYAFESRIKRNYSGWHKEGKGHNE